MLRRVEDIVGASGRGSYPRPIARRHGIGLAQKFRDHGVALDFTLPQTRSGQKILAALTSVCHTPHASGTPTNVQNSAVCQSKPPLPMPNDP